MVLRAPSTVTLYVVLDGEAGVAFGVPLKCGYTSTAVVSATTGSEVVKLCFFVTNIALTAAVKPVTEVKRSVDF